MPFSGVPVFKATGDAHASASFGPTGIAAAPGTLGYRRQRECRVNWHFRLGLLIAMPKVSRWSSTAGRRTLFDYEETADNFGICPDGIHRRFGLNAGSVSVEGCLPCFDRSLPGACCWPW
jgi:hypothetical protein